MARAMAGCAPSSAAVSSNSGIERKFLPGHGGLLVVSLGLIFCVACLGIRHGIRHGHSSEGALFTQLKACAY